MYFLVNTLIIFYENINYRINYEFKYIINAILKSVFYVLTNSSLVKHAWGAIFPKVLEPVTALFSLL